MYELNFDHTLMYDQNHWEFDDLSLGFLMNFNDNVMNEVCQLSSFGFLLGASD